MQREKPGIIAVFGIKVQLFTGAVVHLNWFAIGEWGTIVLVAPRKGVDDQLSILSLKVPLGRAVVGGEGHSYVESLAIVKLVVIFEVQFFHRGENSNALFAYKRISFLQRENNHDYDPSQSAQRAHERFDLAFS